MSIPAAVVIGSMPCAVIDALVGGERTLASRSSIHHVCAFRFVLDLTEECRLRRVAFR